MAARKIITPGTRFHSLTVISLAAPYIGKGHIALRFNCKCDCGKATVARGAALRNGSKKSCGCMAAAQLLKRRTHGHVGTRTYNSWRAIRWRCENQNCPAYPDYGGRGIKQCERWRSFESFLADMGECPEGMSIDRINNDGNYEPGNCRWASKTVQGRNKRTTLFYDFDGVRRPLMDWTELAGVRYKLAHRRLSAGKPAFTTAECTMIRETLDAKHWCSPPNAKGTDAS